MAGENGFHSKGICMANVRFTAARSLPFSFSLVRSAFGHSERTCVKNCFAFKTLFFPRSLQLLLACGENNGRASIVHTTRFESLPSKSVRSSWLVRMLRSIVPAPSSSLSLVAHSLFGYQYRVTHTLSARTYATTAGKEVCGFGGFPPFGQAKDHGNSSAVCPSHA